MIECLWICGPKLYKMASSSVKSKYGNPIFLLIKLLAMFGLAIAIIIIAYGVFKHQPSRYLRANSKAPANIVHLVEWKWDDIADECERYLAPNGFKGIQVSPPTENAIVREHGRPWWERYQIISYRLETRSGNDAQFADMIKRCAAVGVYIYVDAVFNHMAGVRIPKLVGTGGSTGDQEQLSYPDVPYEPKEFHERCGINDYHDPWQVRNCELAGLPDLDQSLPSVRDKILDYLNHLIRLGVAGFRVDAAKHIWPIDLEIIYGRLDDLSTKYFAAKKRPYIYQEVIDTGYETIKKDEYLHLGAITELTTSSDLSAIIQMNDGKSLNELKEYGSRWNYVATEDAVVCVDNHDNQRHEGMLNYKSPDLFKLAWAFTLAHPYGTPCILSSMDFTDFDSGPPMYANEEVISPIFHPTTGQCTNGWICEHRWPEIRRMVHFRNVVGDAPLTNWWDNQKHQIAFCRGNRGFIAINREPFDMDVELDTCMPPGVYCNAFVGDVVNNKCFGFSITVGGDGKARVVLPKNHGVLAIHTESMVIMKPTGKGDPNPTHETPKLEENEKLAESENPVDEERPAESESPADGETPAESETPVDEERPAESESPADEGTPAESAVPDDVETQANSDSPQPANNEPQLRK